MEKKGFRMNFRAAIRMALEESEVKSIDQEIGKGVDQSGKLSQVDPSLAKYLSESGLSDGDPGDDKLQVKKTMVSASKLKPSQTTIRLDKVIGMALFMLKQGKVGGQLGAIISSDGHIMDGHHRWAASVLADGPGAKVGGYMAAMPGKDLIKVLNIMTKGEFGRQKGNAGSGNISDISPKKTRKTLEKIVEKGISGDFPVPADSIKKTLEKNFGSVEAGIDQLSKNAAKISKQVPGWAPARTEMPVIQPEEVGGASSMLNQGLVNWNKPYVSPEQEAPSFLASSIVVASRFLAAKAATRFASAEFKA
jgi:hypothetical protein